jgi:glycosyltransferase involved in cell wall biosynthesis
MRIGMLVSNLKRLPPSPRGVPQGFAGAPEQIAWMLTEQLVKKGHDVTLFASGDSKTSAHLVSVSPLASVLDNGVGLYGHIDYEYWLIDKALIEAKKRKMDVLHTHIPKRTAILAHLSPCPIVATLHTPTTQYRIFNHHKHSMNYVSISNAQRKGYPPLNFVQTIYNGIDLRGFQFQSQGGDSLIFAGRIIREKGLHTALDVAHQMRKVLEVFGDVPFSNPEDAEYYKREIQTRVKSSDHLRGFLPQSVLQKEMGRSRVLLVPIGREESFGLVVIEANATGTPAVAFARGSMPELIKDGVNGFLVKPGDLRGMVKAVKRIYDMPEAEYRRLRENSRRHVEENFTVEKMVDGYIKVYEKVIKEHRSRH